SGRHVGRDPQLRRSRAQGHGERQKLPDHGPVVPQPDQPRWPLGPLRWNGDTTLEVRREVIKPFFDQYLKDGAPKAKTPPVLIYNRAENHWDRFISWPQGKSKPIYLIAGFGLSFTAPGGGGAYDEYVSDPAKPVPYMPRPTRFKDTDAWRRWL